MRSAPVKMLTLISHIVAVLCGVFAGLAGPALYAQSAAAADAQPLSSVALDPTLFREGAITRFSGTNESWNYVCDEIAKLKKRFCSLRTVLRNAEGRVVAALTISTGEDGRPAALLKMAATEFNETGIQISPVAELPPAKATRKSKPKTPSITKLYPASCTNDICQMVWTLPVDQIEALNAGTGLKMRYHTPVAGQSQLATALKNTPPAAVDVTIPSAGFSAAVDASVK